MKDVRGKSGSKERAQKPKWMKGEEGFFLNYEGKIIEQGERTGKEKIERRREGIKLLRNKDIWSKKKEEKEGKFGLVGEERIHRSLFGFWLKESSLDPRHLSELGTIKVERRRTTGTSLSLSLVNLNHEKWKITLSLFHPCSFLRLQVRKRSYSLKDLPRSPVFVLFTGST